MKRKLIIPLVCLLLCLVPFIRGNGPKEAETDLFSKANELYRQGDYAGAVKAYEEVAKTEQNTAVTYNLGNAYFKLLQSSPRDTKGLLGKAILCYEKVLKADPRDRDARANLKYARSLTIDKLEVKDDSEGVYGLLVRLYHFPNTWELEVAMTILIWILVIIVVLRRYVKRETLAELLFWILFIVLPLTLVVVLWTGSRAWSDEARLEGVVLADKVAANGAPQEDATHVFTLHEGTKVRIMRSSKGWLHISLPNGFAGWLREEAIGKIY